MPTLDSPPDPAVVRRLLGEAAYPQNYVPALPLEYTQARRVGADHKVFLGRMKLFENFILCRYLEGYSPELIADILTAHPETVRIRIRRAGLFPTKSRGKPRKGMVHPTVAYYRNATRQTFEGIMPSSFYA